MTNPSRVLVVSRSEPARRLLRLLLEREGFECASAEDGDAAFELLDEDGASVLLLDLRAPLEEDVLFMGLLRRRRPDIGTFVLHEGGARVSYRETEHLLSFGQGEAFPEIKDLTRCVAWLLAEDQL
ncbi:MAG: response regulator, partial [Myxococcaceae bacterium]